MASLRLNFAANKYIFLWIKWIDVNNNLFTNAPSYIINMRVCEFVRNRFRGVKKTKKSE